MEFNKVLPPEKLVEMVDKSKKDNDQANQTKTNLPSEVYN